jgi:hypothetical protein
MYRLDLIKLVQNFPMFKEGAKYFDRFEEMMGVVQRVEFSGLKMEKDRNIVQP